MTANQIIAAPTYLECVEEGGQRTCCYCLATSVQPSLREAWGDIKVGTPPDELRMFALLCLEASR